MQLTNKEVILKILKSLERRDFISFCDWMRIENKAGKTISFSWASWHWEQQQFQVNRNGKDIILKARQVGFSTLELLRDLFFALSVPNSNVVIVVTDNKLAKDFLDRIKRFYKSLNELTTALGYPNVFPSLNDKSAGLRNQRQEISLANGSTIKSLSAGMREDNAKDTGRGNTIHRLHMSEVAFWKFPTETITTLVGCLVPDAEVIIESTPNGIGDWFYKEIQASQQDKSPYKFHFFPWYEHQENRLKLFKGEKIVAENEIETKLVTEKNITLEQLKWYQEKRRELKNINKLLTEHPIDTQSCFVSSGNMFLTSDMRAYIEDDIFEPIAEEEMAYGEIWENLKIYEEPLPASYILTSDVSAGTGGDDSTICVINADSGNIAATYANNRIDPIALAMLIDNVARKYNKALVVVEENNFGLATLTTLRQAKCRFYKGEFSGNYKGWQTTTKSRDIMWSFLYSQIQDKELGKLSRDIAAQMYILARDSKGKLRAQGKTNASVKGDDSPKDDLVFAYAMAWYVRKETFSKRFNKVSGDSFDFQGSRDFGIGKIPGFI